MLRSKLGKIYRWVLLSIVLQVAFLAFLNSYFSRNGDFKVTSIDLAGVIDNSIKMKLPSGADNIKVSYDGTYLAFMKENSLELSDLVAGQPVKSISPGEDEIIFYRWLPDRNMVIYALKDTTAYSSSIELKTFEMDSGIERTYPPVKNLSKSSKVDTVELSTFTKVAYVKISGKDGRAVVYKFNIMNHLSWIMETDNKTAIMEASLSDMLVYQDEKYRVYSRDGSNGVKEKLGFDNKMLLLGMDTEDRVYTGGIDADGKIKTIYYGKVDQPLSEWTEKKLKKSFLRKDIYVTRNGSLYVYAAGYIQNLTNGKKTVLKGNPVDIIDGYIAVVDGNSFVLQELK